MQQERLDFEGGVYRDRQARVYTASVITLFVCTYNACEHTYIVVNPIPMRQDFKGGVCWDELAEICGNILRAAGFQGAVRFRGSMIFVLTYLKISWLDRVPLGQTYY